MREIIDFKCTYDNAAGVNPEVTRRLDLQFPDAYLHRNSMMILAKAIKEHEGALFCELPFCHTVEAEAMGGSVKLGDGTTGPRAKEYVCESLEDVLKLPEIDFSKGRIREVLETCRILIDAGEHVVLDVSGPFTILNVLIDPKYVFRGMRKTPEEMQQIFDKIEAELLRFVKEAYASGVRYISYADSAASLSIVGPKVATSIVEMFTYKFLKKIDEEIEKDMMILLCPKITFALLGTEKAKFADIKLDEKMKYSNACLKFRDEVRFAGQMCLKNRNYILENQIFKKVELC